MTKDVFGADLHEGDTLICSDGAHRIDRLAEYPGRFVGDHARRAYDGNGWRCTVADHEPFHVLID